MSSAKNDSGTVEELLERIKILEEQNKVLKNEREILIRSPQFIKVMMTKEEEEKRKKKLEEKKKKKLASGYNLINPNQKRFKPRGIRYESQIREEIKRQETESQV
jgi:septal ring factor EnvC (AmiA/AmiB activator)